MILEMTTVPHTCRRKMLEIKTARRWSPQHKI